MQFNVGFPSENLWWFPGTGNQQDAPAGKTERRMFGRRIKPPYSYIELITKAIRASPTRTVTLRQIAVYLRQNFACFRGEYKGWRNSVRHNLSASECFTKILRDPSKPNGKDNFWTLNENCKHCLGERLSSKVAKKNSRKRKRDASRKSGEVVGEEVEDPRTPEERDLVIDFPGCQDGHTDDVTVDLNNNDLVAVSPDAKSDINNNVVEADNCGWSKMTVGNLDDLNCMSSDPAESSPWYHQPRSQDWNTLLPHRGRPLMVPYHQPVAATQSYLPSFPAAAEAVYQTRFCYPGYGMAAEQSLSNLEAMNQRRELLHHLHQQQLRPLEQIPAAPSEEYSDGMSNIQTPSPESVESWAPQDLSTGSLNGRVYQSI